jgi:hypothetical protein
LLTNQDDSQSRQGYDAGSELFEQALDPHEIEHPSPIHPPRSTSANFDPLLPSSNPNTVDPFPQSEQLYPVQITRFRFEIAIFRTERVILLPNDRDALNAFFEQLNEYEFHFYFLRMKREICRTKNLGQSLTWTVIRFTLTSHSRVCALSIAKDVTPRPFTWSGNGWANK